MTSWQIVRIIAGTFILLTLALGLPGSPLYMSQWWLAFTAFVGANLLQSGFIALDSQENARLAAQGKRDKDRDRFELDEEIVLSEAKYLLIDFCVDSFGTQAQTFSNGVRSCKTPEALGKYLRTIAEAAEKHCPERVPSLFKIIQEINETAR